MSIHKDRCWVAFFSQSGKEICDISEAIGRYPDVVFTDNTTISKLDPRIVNCRKLIIRKYRGLNKFQQMRYYTADIPAGKMFDAPTVITLHGWLNIVPGAVCKLFDGKMFNGHPGLISEYEDLKGKDPQVRCFNNIEKYERVGSVVHVVTPGVDEGEIKYISNTAANKCVDLDTTYKVLADTSLRCWLQFFEKELGYTIKDEHIRN